MRLHLKGRAEIKTLPPNILLLLSWYKRPQEELSEDEPPPKNVGKLFLLWKAGLFTA